MAAYKRQHSGANRGHAPADCQRALAIAVEQRQQHDPIARATRPRAARENFGGVLFGPAASLHPARPPPHGNVPCCALLTYVVLTYVVYTRSQETQIETVLCVTQIL